MTRREEEILELIKKDPMISQRDLAQALGISRSSVAVHISSLMKKGLLRGRAYIVDEEAGVLVIGGSNLDMEGISSGELKLYDSNPGSFSISPGGVARNIAENIAGLGLPVRLLSALGRDDGGQMIRTTAQEAGINMEEIHYSDLPTSVYLSVLDEKGEMVVAVNQMDILKELDKEYIQKKDELIKRASVLVLDANLEEETLNYICANYSDKIIFADLVSASKAAKLKDCLSHIHGLKPNLLEMESLVGRKLKNLDDYRGAIAELLELGVKQVYLTLGSQGVLVADESGLYRVRGRVEKIRSVTGAGDAFLAAIIYGSLQQWPLDRLASFAQSAAILTLESEKSSAILDINKIEERRKEIEIENLLW